MDQNPYQSPRESASSAPGRPLADIVASGVGFFFWIGTIAVALSFVLGVIAVKVLEAFPQE